ncbi:MAG: hypothetical protein Q8S24_06315 [Eubacteriales bacterium]|nr:hypothetical protein [Eubacteriales bacterium]
MRKKIGMLVIIIISILLVASTYINQNNKKLKVKIDRQIENLVASQLDGWKLETENDVYQIKIINAELVDGIDTYKEKLNTTAHITYHIVKCEEMSETLFYEGLLRMEIWRASVEDDFYMQGNERNQSVRSNFGQILSDFSWKIFNIERERMNSDNPIDIGSAVKSSRSSSNYEEEFEVNDFGEIVKPGILYYNSVHYGDNLSMTIIGHAYVENMNMPVVVTVKTDKEEGDYHPYWNLGKEQIKQMVFHFKDNYEEKITITDTHTIETFVHYIKSLQFEKFEEQILNIDEYAYIMIDSYEHNIILSKEGVFTNSNHAVCIGKQYVDDIKEIINAY